MKKIKYLLLCLFAFNKRKRQPARIKFLGSHLEHAGRKQHNQ